MNVRRILGLILLVAGVLLVCFGVNATQNVNEKVTEQVTGQFSNTTLWYIIGGSITSVLGIGLMCLKKSD